jgi:hypothetical protein
METFFDENDSEKAKLAGNPFLTQFEDFCNGFGEEWYQSYLTYVSVTFILIINQVTKKLSIRLAKYTRHKSINAEKKALFMYHYFFLMLNTL